MIVSSSKRSIRIFPSLSNANLAMYSFKYWINVLLTTTPIGSHDMCNRIRFQPVDRHKYIFVFQRRVFLEEISEEQHYRFWAHPIMCLEAINIAFFSTPVDSFIRKSSIDETIPKDFF